MSELARRLLAWYRQNGRTLPWRGHPDPYAVWVSEIMLQQTRVETVIPYFERWMMRFPDVADLAAAAEQDVLNLWEGLGYYSRARNLHRAAQIVVEKYGCELPRDVKSLRGLPGIGRYTAGAIASMAFGLDEPTLDGNIRRVFARLFDVREALGTTAAERTLWDLAAENLPIGQAGDYNQALMDLGAAVCTSRNPDCGHCPLNDLCQAYALGVQEARPVRKAKRTVPHYVQAAAVVRRDGRVLLARRPSKGLLGGMWEFPNGRVDGDPAQGLGQALETGYGLRVRVMGPLGIVRHAYTHFRVTVHAFRCEPVRISKNGSLRWVGIDALEDYPMGKVDRQIARGLHDG
ncbi:MAG: A/G-specific adenine glycosylase [Chloroflexi bacterium]|nr:A/G-specific adenine glycosylase [Chloroflexota bacterium]